MFVLSTIRDNVKVKPQHFSKPKLTAVTDEINKKYSNKVRTQVNFFSGRMSEKIYIYGKVGERRRKIKSYHINFVCFLNTNTNITNTISSVSCNI